MCHDVSMPTFIHQPHDKLFKKAMTDIRVAKEFFATYLPEEIQKNFDLRTLKIEKQSFIDEAYKGTEADVVYSVEIDNNFGYLYLLCENQSEIDPKMSFRLLLYTVRLMEFHQKKNPASPLPIVYPIVLYTGKKTWDAPRDVFGLFGEQANLARKILFQPYLLIEVQKISDEDLRCHLWSGMVNFVLKYREVRYLAEFLEVLFPWLGELELQDGVGFATDILYYVWDGIEKNDEKLFVEKGQAFLSSNLKGKVMTLGQFYTQQGLQQGFQQGIEQGIEQGTLEGECKLLIRQLTKKFGVLSEMYVARIKQADQDTLLQWGERVLEAKTLEKIFI
jgi:predicted transposase/invertase (TIGR01784 family)